MASQCVSLARSVGSNLSRGVSDISCGDQNSRLSVELHE